jgi:hypothetical protein
MSKKLKWAIPIRLPCKWRENWSPTYWLWTRAVGLSRWRLHRPPLRGPAKGKEESEQFSQKQPSGSHIVGSFCQRSTGRPPPFLRTVHKSFGSSYTLSSLSRSAGYSHSIFVDNFSPALFPQMHVWPRCHCVGLVKGSRPARNTCQLGEPLLQYQGESPFPLTSTYFGCPETSRNFCPETSRAVRALKGLHDQKPNSAAAEPMRPRCGLVAKSSCCRKYRLVADIQCRPEEEDSGDAANNLGKVARLVFAEWTA